MKPSRSTSKNKKDAGTKASIPLQPAKPSSCGAYASHVRQSPVRPLDCGSCQMLNWGDQCTSCPLGKRILIVGGIERMETRYRQVIEREGGVLDYHSGNMQGGVKKLERCLQRADIILCPVSCNSHGACTLVKKLGKKYNKAIHMMPNFSLSSISKALGTELAPA